MKSLYTALCAMTVLSFPLQTMAEGKPSADDAFKAVLPCVETLRAQKDPTTEELDKCHAALFELYGKNPLITRDITLITIGAFWNGYDEMKARIDMKESATGLPEIEAPLLVAAFKANELAANNEYKGKELVVTGVVHSIDVNFGKVSISIAGDQFGMQNVRAYVTKDQEAAASKLQKGQPVKIKGTCDGLSFMDVSLENAVIL